ncbi:MAG: Hint domain-containing protein [Rhodocyclaceae bacterium]|nr:Hint domain-containing protein [Rhodocyclaceae bacterium]MBX3668680.1 Hint domain-containing protein [Rhodocyclaceae bacterium]
MVSVPGFAPFRDGYVLCFAAGTLIHTKEGLKPIEQIHVGDLVLTQPEHTGELSYKRVTRTTRFDDAPVWSVTYFRKSELERALAERRMMAPGAERRLVITPNHPLWVRGKGWVQVKDLDFDQDELLLRDGEYALIAVVSPLYRSQTEQVAWQQGIFDEAVGELLDFRKGETCEFEEYSKHKDPHSFKYWDASCFLETVELRDGSQLHVQKAYQPSFIDLWSEESYFRTAVHDFEVEDCHTYYVGTEGVWAHNTNCGEAVSD